MSCLQQKECWKTEGGRPTPTPSPPLPPHTPEASTLHNSFPVHKVVDRPPVIYKVHLQIQQLNTQCERFGSTIPSYCMDLSTIYLPITKYEVQLQLQQYAHCVRMDLSTINLPITKYKVQLQLQQIHNTHTMCKGYGSIMPFQCMKVLTATCHL